MRNVLEASEFMYFLPDTIHYYTVLNNTKYALCEVCPKNHFHLFMPSTNGKYYSKLNFFPVIVWRQTGDPIFEVLSKFSCIPSNIRLICHHGDSHSSKLFSCGLFFHWGWKARAEKVTCLLHVFPKVHRMQWIVINRSWIWSWIVGASAHADWYPWSPS